MLTEWNPRDFLVITLLLQFITCVLVFFDVPVARQIGGFIYFTFVPGFLIIKLLKFDELEGLETVLFSVGLSVAFLMLAGLSINEFSILLGFSRPLSLLPLMIILNSLILIGAFLAYLRIDDINLGKVKTRSVPLLALLFLSLPVFSVVGAIWVNAFSNSVILLFMIIAVALLIIAGFNFEKILPPRLQPLAIAVIAISLLFHSSLISNYLVSRSDVNVEYFISKTTETSAYWNSTNPFLGSGDYQRINAMLSVGVLPTVYQKLLNIDTTWMFKILFPLVFSFTPLVLYQVWQKYIGRKYAFISTFLFMAQDTFYTEMLGLNRQMIAELFFALLLLTVLNKKMKPVNKTICFMIFSVALVTSHYAVAEIFMFFISLACISLILMKRPSRNITVAMVVFFFVAMFSWYLYTSNSATFDSLVSYADYIYQQTGEFFNPASRGQTVLRGLGMEAAPTIWNTFSRAFAYLSESLIVVGFVGLITGRVRKNIQFEREYFIFILIATTSLVALVAVPGLAETLNMTRFYHILLFFLAPLCVLGAEFLAKLVLKQERELAISTLLLTVLIPYFLFQTGFVYEVTGSQSWSLALSMHRMNVYWVQYLGYIHDRDVLSAQWFSENVDIQNTEVYADVWSQLSILMSYSMMHPGNINILSNVTSVPHTGIVYLNRLNVVEGIVMGRNYVWNISELSPFYDDMDKIYSNGKNEVYVNSFP